MASVAKKFSFRAMVLLLTLVSGLLTFLLVLFRMMRHPLSWYKKKDRMATPACLVDPALGDHEYMTANGIKFHYVVKGGRTKPLMLLLHGFPEFWYSWREQLKYFGGDYRVVAMDLRGYGDTQRPPNKSDYTLDLLTQDIVMLIQQLGYAKCTLVAHDWGGVIAWRVAIKHPEIVQNFIVMNCPHPKIYSKAISGSLSQILKSWYIFMFQWPFLPELLLSINDYEAFNNIFSQGTANKAQEDLVEIYKHNFSSPGALTAALNYYRCMLSPGKKEEKSEKKSDVLEKTKIPTLVIWGDNDTALEKGLADKHDSVVENLTIRHIPGASHWVQYDKPDLVNQYMRSFLAAEQEKKEAEA